MLLADKPVVVHGHPVNPGVIRVILLLLFLVLFFFFDVTGIVLGRAGTSLGSGEVGVGADAFVAGSFGRLAAAVGHVAVPF